MASYPTTALQPGSTGAAVQQLQNWLVQQGYMTQSQVNTGYGTYGPQTTAAVLQLQKDLGIDYSSGPGYWGPRTLTAVNTSTNNGTTGLRSVAPQTTPQTAPTMNMSTPQNSLMSTPQNSLMSSPQPQMSPGSSLGTGFGADDVKTLLAQGETQATIDQARQLASKYGLDERLSLILAHEMQGGTSIQDAATKWNIPIPGLSQTVSQNKTNNAYNGAPPAQQVPPGGTGNTGSGLMPLDQSAIDTLHFLGFTDAQISSMSAGDSANWAMVGSYLKKQYDLGQLQTQINAQMFNDAYQKALNDPTIAAKYADLATTTAADFQNNLGQIALNAQLTGQNQAMQMTQEQRALADKEAAAGRAYSGFRAQAEQNLNTQEQGIVTSTRNQIQQQLRNARNPIEELYGSSYMSNLPAAQTTYINPLTGQPEIITAPSIGGLTGTVGQQREQDVLNRQQQIYQTMLPPTPTK